MCIISLNDWWLAAWDSGQDDAWVCVGPGHTGHPVPHGPVSAASTLANAQWVEKTLS